MTKISEQKKLIGYLSAFVTPERLKRFDDVLKNRTRYITIALEDIYQSHNTSAVLRSCDCFGIQDVHIIENKNAFSVNPDIALGASKWLTIRQYNKQENNTPECIKYLKSNGYRIVATSLHTQAIDIRELDVSHKFALLFGTEKEGLSPYALNHADVHVKFPMYGFTESFNISVCAALSLFFLTEKIKNLDLNWHLKKTEMHSLTIQWLKNTIKNADLLEKRFKKL
ncbi:MAG: tRNA (guanosine(18)-2'-O)-methyltransferase [Bacteroidetes bacterium ADurb.Bin408]|nr:MAG: tRNA (guanosine(18)-2'-O)-methyltransferase [Bacteroidetes bacterium ADurb.Bin408]